MNMDLRIEDDAIVVRRPEPLSLLYLCREPHGTSWMLRETLDGPPYTTTWGRYTLEVVSLNASLPRWGWNICTTNRDDPTMPVIELVAEHTEVRDTALRAAGDGLRALWALDDAAHDWELAGDPGEEVTE